MALYLEHFGLSEPPFRIPAHRLLLRRRRPRRHARGADLRGAARRGHRQGVGRGRQRQNHAVPRADGAAAAARRHHLPRHAVPPRDEILHAIADELELKLSPERRSVALRELQEHLIALYAAGRRVVILIDEAHAMPEETLEQVRLSPTSNRTGTSCCRSCCSASPSSTRRSPSQLAPAARPHHAFVPHPAAFPARGDEVPRFPHARRRLSRPGRVRAARVRLMARASGGLTRRINILADKALLAAYTDSTHAVTPRHVRAAVRDSEFAPARAPLRPFLYVGAAALAGIAIGAASRWFVHPPVEKPQPAAEALAVVGPVEPAPSAPNPRPSRNSRNRNPSRS